MNTQPFEIGQTVSYTNGSPSIYTGIIVKIKANELVILEEDRKGDEWHLWNAGYAVGACIHPSQIQ